MADEFSTEPRAEAILAALRSISRVLGKEIEFETFVSYMNMKRDDQVPGTQDIVSNTPMWVQLTLPALAKLYDSAFFYGQEVASKAYKDTY